MAALIAPILLTAQTNLSRLNQDERNAARYEITLGNLETKAAKLTDVREAALKGDDDTVHAFIAELDIPDAAKRELTELTPATYTGNASEQAKKI